MMQHQFDIINTTRKNFLQLAESLSIEELNEIPEGFNNNIAWNFGHIIVSQQTLCYVRSGLQPLIETRFIEKYQKGTRPDSWIEAAEIDALKKYLFTLIAQQQKDWVEKKFHAYEKLATQYGVLLSSIEDAISYVATHDALHFGFSKALAKVVTNRQFSDFQHIKISN